MTEKFTLSGNAIDLIPVAAEHLELICDEETDTELWKYEEYVETNREAIREKFISQMNCDYRYNFAARNRNNEIVGFCYVWIAQESRKSWEIGYMVLPQFQGKGYGKESLKLLLIFSFERLHAHKVIGMCNSNNHASAKTMSDCGMSRQGVFRKEYLCNGEWTDQDYFSILDTDYKALVKDSNT